MATTLRPSSLFDVVFFQVRKPQKLVLQRGKSRIVHFRLKVPAQDKLPKLELCLSAFVGRGGTSFFNTVGWSSLMCISTIENGFAIKGPQDARMSAQPSAKDIGAEIEIEPNNSCQTAQDMSRVSFPFSVNGNLDSSQAPDIDFYQFSGTPGEPIIITHEGQPTGKGTLPEPIFGVFDASCNLILSSSETGFPTFRDSMLVPDDGIFILAATGFPDLEFTGGANGTYQLTVTPIRPIGSISGTVTSAFTGKPMSGNEFPYPYVDLMRCEDWGCFMVSTQNVASDGSYLFISEFNGLPLHSGKYYVASGASQHRSQATDTFEVGEGEHMHVDALALEPFPVMFSEVQVCQHPFEIGICEIRVKATNTLATHLSGRAWSVVEAAPTGSFVDYTHFQTDASLSLRLEPGESRLLRFRFRVRKTLPEGAFVCLETYMGQNPDAFFMPMGQALLLCLDQGPNGLTLLPAQDAQAAPRQMQMQSQPSQPLIEMEK